MVTHVRGHPVIDAAELSIRELREIDLLDPNTFVDYDLTSLWRNLRHQSPIFRHPHGFWVLTRYADVVAAYKDPRFGSDGGNVLSTLMAGGDSAAGAMLAVTDGPRHRRLRTALVDALRPRTMNALAEPLRARTGELVRAMTSGQPFDFATEIAERLPMGTICDLMGIPAGDRAELLEWNKQALSSDIAGATEADAQLARGEILLYLSDLVQERRERAGTDVVTELVAHRPEDGEPLSDEEIVYNCYSLLIGGDESSRMSAVCGVLAFCERPEAWRRVRDGEVGVDSTVEEILRWTTPAMHVGRRARAEAEVCGHRIAEGDIVTLWNSSADRDETVFPSPETFDPARQPNRHLAFGYGPHFCVGAQLGRLELRILLEALRESVTEMAPAGKPRRIYSNFLYGYSTLPVVFT
ncbi:cytochrome P450 [Microtetraspora malaysiensis]|uniref:cytochrome P450 n=1 Tax=Microtetraspora malaysiensis TaxID=161358 RepID=UPI003D926946